MSITQKQKRHLKGLVHHLKPVVIFGQNGASTMGCSVSWSAPC